MNLLIDAYEKAKRKYPDAIVFLEVGIFFETLNKDAQITGQIAKVNTQIYQGYTICGFLRTCGEGEGYFYKLRNAGYDVITLRPKWDH